MIRPHRAGRGIRSPMPAPQKTRNPARLYKPFFSLFIPILLLGLIMNVSPAAAKELAPHLYKTKFDNGLTVIVKETPGTKVAAVQIWVKAGSIYEEEKERGITHLIEHMIFKGTPSRGPGEVAGAIESVGGRINAYTSYEYTVYHATLSARYWPTAMEVLADAVLHSTFDPKELAREKKVVLEEIRMRKDRPNITLFQELMAHAYTTHPYRLPVSGTEQSVAAISRDDILAYIKAHYLPENFTIVVAGDVKARQVMKKAKELMGGLPSGQERELKAVPKEPVQKEPRFFAVGQDINQTHMAIAFPISAFASPDTPVFDVMTSILGQGDASRLYNMLRDEKGLVYKIDASSFTPHDPGLLEVTAILDADKVGAALPAALEEIFKMKYLSVSDEELERAKRNLESDFVFNLERAEGQARVLGSFEFLAGDPREDAYLDQVRAVTKEDIRRVAATYLRDDRVTVGIVGPTGAEPEISQEKLTEIITGADKDAKAAEPVSQVGDAYLSNTHRYELANGIRLLVREDPEIPTVAIRVVFPGGLRSETEATNGAFAFIAELLPKGTEKLTARDMARKVADMAGHISGFNGKNTFGLKADFLSRFTDEGLRLVRDVVRTPAFDRQEAEKIRPELLARLKQQEDSLPALAFLEFNKHLFQGHPYALNTAGSEEALKTLTDEQLKTLYEKQARPESMVIAVAGNVKAEKVKDEVTRLFGAWPGSGEEENATEESLLPPDAPARPDVVTIRRNKEQTHIIIGFLGTTIASKDRYGLEVLDTVLSGQSGRLFTELRDKKSLAYSLSSFSLLGLDTGSFGIYIGTSPDKKNDAIKEIWKQLSRVREEPISEAELEKAKNILISNYQLGLQTHGAQAMEMALDETYGLGQDFGARYVAAIEQVDRQTVLDMARKYIQPDHYVEVVVGAE